MMITWLRTQEQSVVSINAHCSCSTITLLSTATGYSGSLLAVEFSSLVLIGSKEMLKTVVLFQGGSIARIVSNAFTGCCSHCCFLLHFPYSPPGQPFQTREYQKLNVSLINWGEQFKGRANIPNKYSYVEEPTFMWRTFTFGWFWTIPLFLVKECRKLKVCVNIISEKEIFVQDFVPSCSGRLRSLDDSESRIWSSTILHLQCISTGKMLFITILLLLKSKFIKACLLWYQYTQYWDQSNPCIVCCGIIQTRNSRTNQIYELRWS